AQQQCTRCHQLPDPRQLPRDAWPLALTWMGNYLGFPDTGGGLERLVAPELVPAAPMIAPHEWLQLRAYFLEHAPTQAELTAEVRKPAAHALDRFEVIAPPVDLLPDDLVTMVRIDAASGHAFIGSSQPARLDGFDRGWHRWMTEAMPSQPVHLEVTATGIRCDVIGDFDTDRMRGAVTDLAIRDEMVGARTELVAGYHRLTQHRTADIDGDGRADLVMAAFGVGAVGRVAVLWAQGGGFDEQVLITRSGAVACEVRDLDLDGDLDLLVLLAQGRNELLWLENLGGRQFASHQLHEWSSSFGLNGMRVSDIDGDGREDIVIVNGNGMEIEDPLRPYHGAHVLSRRGAPGEVAFEESFFYPMYGAIGIGVADFDGDGDADLAVCSFFFFFYRASTEIFTWLEQTSSGAFVPHTLDAGHPGRWLTMDVGDLDGDGRPDVILGGGVTALGVPHALVQRYLRLTGSAPAVMYLHNIGGAPARR
nr:VCBS repeat-containing protein [Planctomycetota bacterium]